MSYAVQLDESNASRRVVHLWCVQSNGTSAATNEGGGRPLMTVGGTSMWTTENTLSANSANAGLYSLVLGASDISRLGQGVILYSSGTALPTTVNVEIVGYNPFTAYSLFTSGDSVGLKAAVHSGATVAGLVSDVSIRNGAYSAVTIGGVTRLMSAVTLAAGRYSDVTVGGVEKVESTVTPAPGTYSDITVQVNGIAPGTYSGVTVGVNNIAPGNYSGVTIAGVTRVNSNVTIADGRYSAVTIGGVEALESGVTVAPAGIDSAAFAAGAIDAVALATDAGQEIADRILQRNIMGGSDSGRTVSEALAMLRNRVAIDGSAGTVYRENDSTSYWTFSVATVSANSGIVIATDPG